MSCDPAVLPGPNVLIRPFGLPIPGPSACCPLQEDTPIQSPLLNQSLESAQRKVEAYYFDTRKQLFEYDEALNRQRNGVYKERKRILQQKNLRPWIIDYAERTIYDLFLNPSVELKTFLFDNTCP